MMAQLIREAARQCMAEEMQAEILFGKVLRTEPLAVSVENRLTLEGSCLLVPKELERREISLTFGKETQNVLLSPGLQAGDAVILLRMGGYFLAAGRLPAGE